MTLLEFSFDFQNELINVCRFIISTHYIHDVINVCIPDIYTHWYYVVFSMVLQCVFDCQDFSFFFFSFQDDLINVLAMPHGAHPRREKSRCP